MRRPISLLTRLRRPGCRGARHRLPRDDGSVSVEIAILFPAVLLLITGIVQYGLWFHARSVALAAAQEGVATAAAFHAAPGAGADRAQSFLVAHAADSLSDVEIAQTVPDPGRVAVQVTGRAVSLLPGVAGPAITQSAEAPVERFTVAGAP